MDMQKVVKLCDPDYPLEQSLLAARNLMKTEPMLDVELARMLPRNGHGSEGLAGRAALRALEILDAISPGTRLVLPLSPLVHHDEPALRSKAALVIGRRVQNLNWMEKHLQEVDPRVRANVLESLWHNNSLELTGIFRHYQRDSHNRVAGNALIGLYLREPEEAVQNVRAMAEHAEGRFRVTAAWVMGMTANARFLGIIKTLMRDPDEKVRSAACRALFKIKNGKSPLNPQAAFVALR
ncbi:MAG: HEAT repeat domain-containing protein [Acidobacteria bacterium]|nr:HEAT repeat domain-containing protein [Acidobacteriota bacterium]